MTKRRGKQIRVEFRKKREIRTRHEADLTREFQDSNEAETFDTLSQQRISGKGRDTRRRTIIGEADPDTSSEAGNNSIGEASIGDVQLSIDETAALRGVVLRVHGLDCIVRGVDGNEYRCAIRRLLKSLATDQRHVVVAGDRVRFRREGTEQGMILRIDTRYGTLSRTSKNRRHVIVANVDQILIVTSAAEPGIKPNLIDRFLITAQQNRIDACIIINKCDLIDPAELMPLVGIYAQMGYRVEMVSAKKAWGVKRLQKMLLGRQSVVVGQSGVGKSSILNAIEPGMQQRVQSVSQDNQKGRHTTTTSEVFPIALAAIDPEHKYDSTLVDTPGIRQFQLYDIAPAEISGLFRDLRPLASRCRFPNCSHLHESDCAVKDALADYRISVRRYESYCQMVDDPGEAIIDRGDAH